MTADCPSIPGQSRLLQHDAGKGTTMSGNERILRPISLAELERRWSSVRSGMREQGIDALVMQNTNDWLGGYVKYFTHVPANNGYPRTVIFPAADMMTVIEM